MDATEDILSAATKIWCSEINTVRKKPLKPTVCLDKALSARVDRLKGWAQRTGTRLRTRRAVAAGDSKTRLHPAVGRNQSQSP